MSLHPSPLELHHNHVHPSSAPSRSCCDRSIYLHSLLHRGYGHQRKAKRPAPVLTSLDRFPNRASTILTISNPLATATSISLVFASPTANRKQLRPSTKGYYYPHHSRPPATTPSTSMYRFYSINPNSTAHTRPTIPLPCSSVKISFTLSNVVISSPTDKRMSGLSPPPHD